MSKSIYSLVLSDDIVAEIDRLAYNTSTSRSNMINRILAEYVSYTTPEQHTRDIFSAIEELLTGGDVFQALLAPTDTLYSLRSALTYKYNPSIKYSIELYKQPTDVVGELRVSIRSKNSTLLLYVLQFFKLWAALESAHFDNVGYTIQDGRFVRRLVPRGVKETDTHALADAISSYVHALDNAIKVFFAHTESPERAINEVRNVYERYIANVSATV